MARHQFNRHLEDFQGQCDFTIEFNVKNPDLTGVPEDIWEFEWQTGSFTGTYGDSCFEEIKKAVGKRTTWEIVDWSFAGRSNGWYALLCRGDEKRVTPKTIEKICKIIDKYLKNYNREIREYYQIHFD